MALQQVLSLRLSPPVHSGIHHRSWEHSVFLLVQLCCCHGSSGTLSRPASLDFGDSSGCQLSVPYMCLIRLGLDSNYRLPLLGLPLRQTGKGATPTPHHELRTAMHSQPSKLDYDRNTTARSCRQGTPATFDIASCPAMPSSLKLSKNGPSTLAPVSSHACMVSCRGMKAEAAPPVWACPKCRHDYAAGDTPTEYRCCCGKEADPEFNAWLAPHTCGARCDQPLACALAATAHPHTCLLLCHPGPCPPCPRQVRALCRTMSSLQPDVCASSSDS